MDNETLRDLADVRAQSDTKALKRTIASYYALLGEEMQGEKLEAAHVSFTVALDQLAQQLAKSRRIEQVAAWEIDSYRQEVATLEQSSEETRQKLAALGEKLTSAQQERARRIEYDGIAKTIARLPDRQKGQESLDKLNADIDLLRQEERTYAETWQMRKLAFDSIVTSLEAMQEAIRDEKAEQERRRALDEDDGEEVAAGTAGTGGATNTRAQSLDPNAKPFVPGANATDAKEGEDEKMEGVEVTEGQQQECGRRERNEGQMMDDREEGEM
ncbi:hypothetical protein RTBOTA2_003405 [Rhodotorula toruloides]|uniref:BY PROTMAP: gi/647397946/emb/CDR41404.1/ RHTO0S06e01530g1_1 [Rhodosporidium toruloides] n=1 Tax=Rhodotorula toruloides TaxID=5286 RepID=A0A0K3C846_RHOTO|nr:hypothetical protein RTBOTA2_003405 [Rhodotorula toruloides]PRQ76556.1 hypothetical protein AAT19DRAFT_11974 [Rhodotorula toruloides]